MEIKQIVNSKTIRNGGLFSIYSFFNKGINFLLLILLANYIVPSQYGELSMFNTVVMLLGYIVSLSVQSYMSISFFQKDELNFKQDFTAICIITSTCFIVITLLFLINTSWWASLLKIPSGFVIISVLLAFLTVFVQMNLDFLRIQEKIKEYGILSCGYASINMALTLYFVIVQKLNWQGFVYAKLVCDFSFFIISIILFVHNHLFLMPKVKHIYTTILLYGIPLIPHNISNWLRQGCDRYIINYYYDTYNVGLFSFALNLISIIIMIGTAFNATNSVNIYQTLSSKSLTVEEKQRKLKYIEKIIALLYIGSTIAIVLGCALLIPLLLPKYTESIPYFLILSIYGLLTCLYFLKCNYLFYFEKTRLLMTITLGSSIIHLLLSLTFTRFGLVFTCVIYSIVWGCVLILIKNKTDILFADFLKKESTSGY